MKLRLILGDQLNHSHSWFKKENSNVIYTIMEVKQETSYVLHHIQKIVGFFLAMRNFSDYLSRIGHEVIYTKIDDPRNQQTFSKNLIKIIKKNKIDKFEYIEPDEYRLDMELKNFCKKLSIPYKMVSAEHFLTKRTDLRDFFQAKKSFLMETFYRHMRKKYDILLDSNKKPVGGQWNFDIENRKKLPANFFVPSPLLFHHDVRSVLKQIKKMNIETFGSIDAKHFNWPINKKESILLLDYFINNSLRFFGTYEDAMSNNHWLLFHSRLSFSLNIKMLHPLEVINKAIIHYENNKTKEKISQIEGFVRQILGWREYLRGVYWAKMPDYSKMNFFCHNRKLPQFYWTGKTKMNCMYKSINQSLDHAYAHHIQRLMILGNFALLSGSDPNEVDQWYLGVYIDAVQWVELTNTRGMSQFADGGIVATKPYVASSNYISKMSNYCKYCYYDKNKKIGSLSCPFNSLYWRFFEVNKNLLYKKFRIGMIYKIWDKYDDKEKAAILKTAENHLRNLNNL